LFHAIYQILEWHRSGMGARDEDDVHPFTKILAQRTDRFPQAALGPVPFDGTPHAPAGRNPNTSRPRLPGLERVNDDRARRSSSARRVGSAEIRG
jgi:hypothetical protein